MPRRRLKLSYSSDEEQLQNENHQQFQEPTVSHQTVTINPLHPDSNAPEPLQISDDDDEIFVDVSDNLSPPSPPTAPRSDHFSQHPPPQETAPSSGGVPEEVSGCPISDFLRKLGLRLKGEWLDACVNGLETTIQGFANLDVAAKAKLCFQQFLVSDMNFSGAGVLPENVDSMHLCDLPGPYVLQVDEIVNISCPLRGRYQTAPAGIKRCLKLSMTDGVQRVFGMEYRPIRTLEAFAPAGLKVAICNVHVRHGLLMLVPDAFEILGGMVEELETARQRLVNEVNKPPRGRRTRTGVVPPLATRATLAAWPSNGVSGLGNTDTSIFQNDVHSESNHRGVGTFQRANEGVSLPVSDGSVVSNPSNSGPDVAINMDTEPSGAYTVPDATTNNVLTAEDDPMVDIEHPLMLSGDREVPFTYLASLSAKWAAMKEKTSSVQGKIKCFLTGVKGFQYKQRTMYELRVYVDDGSLISDILIDHNVVQKGIGHSPKDVTAALLSSNTKVVSDMKETLKQFQVFLANFEGTMLMEISKTFPLPVALEMNQGCSQSDARLLLTRLKSLKTAPAVEHPPSELIELSP